MTPSGSLPPVEKRWQGAGDGKHYKGERFRSARARDRDPRLVARLLRSLASGGVSVASVLDVPCGTGRLREATVKAAAARGVRPVWTGADISHEMLAEVSAGEARLVRAGAEALPFPDGSFDLVLCCRLLHHLQDAEARHAVIAELARVARGTVVASYWDAASYQAWRRRTSGLLRRKGALENRRAVEWGVLRGEMEACGLRVLGRAFSMRFVSQQAFVIATVSGQSPRTWDGGQGG